ncbi:unnamed protein product [Chrysoparadoxa australica]
MSCFILSSPELSMEEKVVVYFAAAWDAANDCNHVKPVSKEAQSLQEFKSWERALLEDSRVRKARGRGKGDSTLSSNKINIARLRFEMEEYYEQAVRGTGACQAADPRVTVAWCKRHKVPIERIFIDDTQRELVQDRWM